MNQFEFWDFCLTVYAVDNIDNSCLRLQDQHGYDIIMLLFVIWHGCRGIRLERERLSELVAFSAAWRENVVSPLRHARRYLKIQNDMSDIASNIETEPFRSKIKSLELGSENLQAQALVLRTADLAANSMADSERADLCLFNVTALGKMADLALCDKNQDDIRFIITSSLNATR